MTVSSVDSVEIIVAPHAELVIRGIIAEALVFPHKVHAEGHGLRSRLVAAVQAFPVKTVTIQLPAPYFQLQLGFVAVVVFIRAKLVIGQGRHLLGRHLECRRRTCRQKQQRGKNKQISHSINIVPSKT